MNDLTCRYLPRLDSLPAADLGRLFPEPSTAAPHLSLVQDSGVDGFTLGSIVVFRNEVPILLLPLFETRFDLSAFVEGWLKKVLKAAGRLIPAIFHPRVLCMGSVDAGWSELGIAPDLDTSTRFAACKMAFAELQTVAIRHGSDVVALYNFNEYGGLPEELLTQFNRVPFRPCARLSIDFGSIEEYLSKLSRGSRKHLRRKMRVAPEVRIEHSRDISPFMDRIYALYEVTVARSPMPLGIHRRFYFEEVCRRVPGAEYVLYFVQDELVAFNLIFVKPEEMVDKYFCMNYGPGSKYNLYALSWLENVRVCAERKIPFYYAGQGTEETKAHLGATFIPSYLLFRHRWPVFDRLLVGPHALTGKILNCLGLWPSATPAAAKVAACGAAAGCGAASGCAPKTAAPRSPAPVVAAAPRLGGMFGPPCDNRGEGSRSETGGL
jgi:uncharacterized protein